jgi:uncharacterized membrane protein
MSVWFTVLVCMAVVGLSTVAGFFLTFSDFLMRSLRMARAQAGVEVMQIINREVWKSFTIGLLWGSLGLTLLLVGAGAATGVSKLPLALIATGSALYVVGGLVVSYARNLPMNARLEAMDASSATASAYWRTEYIERWVRWNWVRAVASWGAAVCFLLALLQRD